MVAIYMQVHPAAGSISPVSSLLVMVAVVAFSALMHLALTARKKLQRVVLTLALAFVLAGQIAAVANGFQKSKQTAMPVYYMPFCEDWAYYMNFMCWFEG